MLAVLTVVWSPIAQAADRGSAKPAVQLPLRKAPPHVRPAAGAPPAPQGYIPCDITRAYHLDLLQASGLTGAGQRIAVITALDNPNVQSDLHAFDTAFGLPDPSFQVVNLGAVPGSAIDQGWDSEMDLDVEWTHAAAPAAAITLVEAPLATIDKADLLAAVDYAVNVAGADVVSMSWLAQEFTGETLVDSHFPSTNPQGKPVMYVASAGDSGFGTGWPAVSPRVLGVGGTSLAPSAVGKDTQHPHLDCSRMSSSPGVTAQNETAWGNPGCVGSTCEGTGGGISTFEDSPAWQTGLGLPKRGMPDVAMVADPATGVALFTNGNWSNFQWGGTSLGAPLWSGMIALFNQQRQASGQSNLNITPGSNWAYQLTTLNDIVTGSSPSQSSDPCLTAGTCRARAGYDLVTGLGSPMGSLAWEALGGSINSAPSAASQGQGSLDIFARGPGSAVWQRSSSGGQWGSWQSLGGATPSAPGVVAWSAGRLDLFVRGTDGGLWHRWWTGAWSGWEPLGGGLSSGPAAASWSAGRLDVLVRGTDNGLWHKWWDGSGWRGWEAQGGVLAASEPGAVSWSHNRLDVFIRGSDNGMWHKWWDGRSWNGWESFGGSLISGPAVGSPARSQLDVFALTTNGTIQHRAFSGRWGTWLSLGGHSVSGPGVVSQRNGTLDVFETGSDGQLRHVGLSFPTI
jgi:hypothetical protein